MNGDVTAAPRPGPGLRISIAFLVVATLLVLPALVQVVRSAVHTLRSPAVSTPAVIQRHLGEGRYVVFERTGTRRGGGGVTFSTGHTVTMSPEEVSVVGPEGRVPVSFMTSNQTVTRGSAIYTGALRFDTPRAGNYVIGIGGPPRRVLVARSIGDTFADVGGWWAVGALGVTVWMVGVAMLVIGVIRRNRVDALQRRVLVPSGPWPPMAPPVLPPAGWYPDPGGEPGRQRYWDGSVWTDHLS